MRPHTEAPQTPTDPCTAHPAPQNHLAEPAASPQAAAPAATTAHTQTAGRQNQAAPQKPTERQAQPDREILLDPAHQDDPASPDGPSPVGLGRYLAAPLHSWMAHLETTAHQVVPHHTTAVVPAVASDCVQVSAPVSRVHHRAEPAEPQAQQGSAAVLRCRATHHPAEALAVPARWQATGGSAAPHTPEDRHATDRPEHG